MVTDTIQSQVASNSTTLDPECFVYKWNELSSRSEFSEAVGSKNAKPQDCELFESQMIFKSMTPFEDIKDCELFEDATAAFVSSPHSENPSGVTLELLAKVLRIDNAIAKLTVKVTTHTPNPQDLWDEEDRPIHIPEADAMDEKWKPLSPNSIADTLINAEVILPHG